MGCLLMHYLHMLPAVSDCGWALLKGILLRRHFFFFVTNGDERKSSYFFFVRDLAFFFFDALQVSRARRIRPTAASETSRSVFDLRL